MTKSAKTIAIGIAKKFACFLLVGLILIGLSGCSAVELTEENVTSSINTVETALKEFDTKTLNKYVNSETLGYITKFADSKEQFHTLGTSIFESLEIEIISIDLQAKTVELSVTNKELKYAAAIFANQLQQEYSTTQLLGLLDNDQFLDEKIGYLTDQISTTTVQPEPTVVTVGIEQGKKNLVFVFDEEAENAVSGGALTAIKSAFSPTVTP